ncbi:claudin-3-like [Brachyhypopomus gauderio]|uniref:claudin-3-like n=1 Tax=Brachyhypopomus gauderio TaxID=698409 RepID=UPI00404365EF
MDEKVEWVSYGVTFAGWLCTIFTRFLPVWNVSGTMDNVTDALPLYWDGVWLNWQDMSTGILHCSFYQSLLFLAASFRSWKALLTASIGMGIFPVVGYLVGIVKFPRQAYVKGAAGLGFLLSGLLLLVAVSWTTHATYSDLDSKAPLARDWGAALYCGWTGSVLLLVGGGALSTLALLSLRKPREQTRPAQTTEQNLDDPLFAIHRAAFIPGPYQHTTRPV